MSDELTGMVYEYQRAPKKQYIGHGGNFFKGAIVGLIFSVPFWAFVAYVIWRW